MCSRRRATTIGRSDVDNERRSTAGPVNGRIIFPFEIVYGIKIDNNKDAVADIGFEISSKQEIPVPPNVFTGFIRRYWHHFPGHAPPDIWMVRRQLADPTCNHYTRWEEAPKPPARQETLLGVDCAVRERTRRGRT